MYALDKVLENVDVEVLLEELGFEVPSTDSDIIRTKCAIHGGDNPTSFVMNKENTLWYCHSGDCGGGDAIELVRKMKNYSFPKAVQWLSELFEVDIDGLEIVERKSRLKQHLKSFIKAMKSVKEKDLDEYIIDVEVKPLKTFRNYDKDTIDFFNIGFIDTIELMKRNGESYTLKNRLCFPIVFNNKQVGVALRRTKSKDMPKWSNQPVNVDYGSILYNYDNIIGKTQIVVAEGITDVMAYHEIGVPAVATFGAHLTDNQYRLLIKTGADIILAYDNDKAGNEAKKKAIKMLKNKTNLFTVDLPAGRDAGDITREELLDAYKSRKKC